MENTNRKKRVRVNVNSDESEFNSPEVKKLKENLLDDLINNDSEFPATCHDFDSFMKTLEEQITPSPATEVVDLTADSDESTPELGYLLEASDDELGIPPRVMTTVEIIKSDGLCESNELSNELWELDERIPNYDLFDLGIYSSSVCDYVAIDGLFDDHSDLGFGSPDFLWRPETLPAN
ncbi:uncharacterized protein LOC132615143 [Lycium barbarum]|uniref:uncharacterized protein LOC132615143 n=1 Tax=Lycium barbarum TaxID=112863 RepID=UPI00293EC4A9|nr:uncharacterized protein LOC132615143 [Lycium barbarum]